MTEFYCCDTYKEQYQNSKYTEEMDFAIRMDLYGKYCPFCGYKLSMLK